MHDPRRRRALLALLLLVALFLGAATWLALRDDASPAEDPADAPAAADDGSSAAPDEAAAAGSGESPRRPRGRATSAPAAAPVASATPRAPTPRPPAPRAARPALPSLDAVRVPPKALAPADAAAPAHGLVRLTPPDDVRGSEYGVSVAIDGELAVVGAPAHQPPGRARSGAVFVFERRGASWVYAEMLLPLAGGEGARFGEWVATSQGRVFATSGAGGPGSASSSGAVLVFEHERSKWRQTGSLGPPDGARDRGFPGPLAASGGRLAVGDAGAARGVLHTGEATRVHVFRRAAGAGHWEVERTIEDPGAADRKAEQTAFGAWVDMDSHRLVVTSPPAPGDAKKWKSSVVVVPLDPVAPTAPATGQATAPATAPATVPAIVRLDVGDMRNGTNARRAAIADQRVLGTAFPTGRSGGPVGCSWTLRTDDQPTGGPVSVVLSDAVRKGNRASFAAEAVDAEAGLDVWGVPSVVYRRESVRPGDGTVAGGETLGLVQVGAPTAAVATLLLNPDDGSARRFGAAVAVSHATVIVGSPAADGAGEGTAWVAAVPK